MAYTHTVRQAYMAYTHTHSEAGTYGRLSDDIVTTA